MTNPPIAAQRVIAAVAFCFALLVVYTIVGAGSAAKRGWDAPTPSTQIGWDLEPVVSH